MTVGPDRPVRSNNSQGFVTERAPDDALLFHSTVGRATTCVITKWHWPKPLRFVWHHVLPETCGGPTNDVNLISVCDSCHYAIHAILYYMATNHGQLPKDGGNRAQRKYALIGYAAAKSLGTIDKIPNEGSVLT